MLLSRMNDCGHRAVISEQNFLPSSPPLGQFTFTEKKLGCKESEPAVSVNSARTRQALTSCFKTDSPRLTQFQVTQFLES